MRPYFLLLAFCLLASLAHGSQGPDGTGVLPRSRQGYFRSQTSGVDAGEFLMDTNQVTGPAGGVQSAPAVAFGGAQYLVVWEDSCESDTFDIYGALVTETGDVLSASGIPISTAARAQRCPAVAFDGTNYLVVWQDGRGSSIDIYGARVNSAGIVLDRSGIHISAATGSQTEPSVAFDGTNFFVVWQDARSGSRIYGARVSSAGVVLEPSGVPISPISSSSDSRASVASDGTNSLVVWQHTEWGFSENIFAARVTQHGDVLDPGGLPVARYLGWHFTPAAAFDGENFIVAYQACFTSSPYRIFLARVTPQGVVLDSFGIQVTSGPGDQTAVAAGFDGMNSVVAWEDTRNGTHDIYSAHVSKQGRVLDRHAVSTAANDQSMPSVACVGTKSLVVWKDLRNGVADVFGARVGPDGSVRDSSGFVVATQAGDQRTPAVTADSANFLVVWSDGPSGYSDIYATRVTPAGTRLDLDGIRVSFAQNSQEMPVVCFGGTNYLAVWEDERSGFNDIYGARVRPDGAVLDSAGIAVSTAPDLQFEPAVSFDATGFFVVWTDLRSHRCDIYATRVSPGGAVLDSAGIAVSMATADQWEPAVACDGTNYLVAWRDTRNGRSDIYGARVSPAGTVLDTAGIAISSAVGDQTQPSMAFDGTHFLVVWQDTRSGWSCIYGARLTRDGTLLDTVGIPISTANAGQRDATVASDGAGFLVAWTDERDGTPDVYGAWVSPAGVVIDSGPVVTEGNPSYPSLACGPGNRLLLAYQCWAGTVCGRAYNTERIWGKLDPSAFVEETSEVSFPTGPDRATMRVSIEAEVLYNAAGRRVTNPGPGVYFIREKTAGSGEQYRVRKVIIAR